MEEDISETALEPSRKHYYSLTDQLIEKGLAIPIKRLVCLCYILIFIDLYHIVGAVVIGRAHDRMIVGFTTTYAISALNL